MFPKLSPVTKKELSSLVTIAVIAQSLCSFTQNVAKTELTTSYPFLTRLQYVKGKY